MNLSERLDAARQKRDLGFAADLSEEGYVLRATVEGHRYEGQSLLGGDTMDAERWREVQSRRAGMELPRLGDELDREDEAPARPVSAFLDLTGDDPVINPDAGAADAVGIDQDLTEASG